MLPNQGKKEQRIRSMKMFLTYFINITEYLCALGTVLGARNAKMYEASLLSREGGWGPGRSMAVGTEPGLWEPRSPVFKTGTILSHSQAGWEN